MSNHNNHIDDIYNMLLAAWAYIGTGASLVIGIMTGDTFIRFVGLVLTFFTIRYYYYATKKVRNKNQEHDK